MYVSSKKYIVSIVLAVMSVVMVIVGLWGMLTIDWWSEPWKDIKLFLSLLAFIVGVILLLNALIIAYIGSGCTIDISIPWQNIYIGGIHAEMQENSGLWCSRYRKTARNAGEIR